MTRASWTLVRLVRNVLGLKLSAVICGAAAGSAMKITSFSSATGMVARATLELILPTRMSAPSASISSRACCTPVSGSLPLSFSTTTMGRPATSIVPPVAYSRPR